MAITSKGSKWERSESCYIIIAFIPLINWIAFVYTGLITNTKKWVYWSILYSTPFILMIYFFSLPGGLDRDYSVLNRYCNLIQIMTIVHAFMMRKEYLVRLEAKGEGKALTKGEVKAIIEKNKLINLEKKNLEVGEISENTKEFMINELDDSIEQSKSLLTLDNIQVRKEVKIVRVNRSIEKSDDISSKDKKEMKNIIDINTASESELASLPSIGLILAKKAINHRDSKGFFTSIEEFAETLSLKPHVLERIKPLIIVNKVKSDYKSNELSNKAGRIIDF